MLYLITSPLNFLFDSQDRVIWFENIPSINGLIEIINIEEEIKYYIKPNSLKTTFNYNEGYIDFNKAQYNYVTVSNQKPNHNNYIILFKRFDKPDKAHRVVFINGKELLTSETKVIFQWSEAIN